MHARTTKIEQCLSLIPNHGPSALQDRRRLENDVKTLFRTFTTLTPMNGTFSGGGRTVTLFYLYGVVPINYRGNTYNIPITIYFDPPYPRSAPRCFVTPTQNMALKAGHTSVDAGGMIYLPYLSNWDQNSSNLPDLMSNIAAAFSNEPPVHSTTAAPRPQTQAASQSMQMGGYGGGARQQAVPVVTATPMTPGNPMSRHNQMARAVENQAKEKWISELKPIVDDTNVQIKRLQKLEEESSKADTEIARMASAVEAHRERKGELIGMEESLRKFVAENRNKEPDPDSFAGNLDGDSEQVLNLLAEELALEDFLVTLDELLTDRKMGMEDFLRETRNVARDQFMLKAKRQKAAAAVAAAAAAAAVAASPKVHSQPVPAGARIVDPSRIAAAA